MTVFRKAYPEYRVRLIFIKDKKNYKKTVDKLLRFMYYTYCH